MINFVGIGSAFNTALGNNSGVIKRGTSMILIDCGGTVFDRLKKSGLLSDITNLHIIITHTHPDHVGSLGDLIFYCYYKLKVKPIIYFPENTVLMKLFSVVGVKENQYNLKTSMKNQVWDKNLGDYIIEFFPSSHTKSIPAFGFYLTIDKKNIYYSGDSNKIPKGVMEKLKSEEVHIVYQDTTSIDFVKTGHMSFKSLCDTIDVSLRHRVYCMHLDENLDNELILNAGFNIAPLIGEL